jgi:hypothetical protein
VKPSQLSQEKQRKLDKKKGEYFVNKGNTYKRTRENKKKTKKRGTISRMGGGGPKFTTILPLTSVSDPHPFSADADPT